MYSTLSDLTKGSGGTFLRAFAVLGLPIAFLLLACSIGQTSECSEELNRNRQLWSKAELSRYTFVAKRWVGGQKGYAYVDIDVNGSAAPVISPTEAFKGGESVNGYDDFATVERMFEQVQVACSAKTLLDVAYNKEFGFPESVKIETNKTSIHNSFTIEITNFTPSSR